MKTEGQVDRGYYHNNYKPDLAPMRPTEPRRTPKPSTAPWPTKRQRLPGDHPGRKHGDFR